MLTNAKGFVIALVVSLLLFAKPVWGQEFTVNLKDTDIQEFIEFVADVTGTTIVIDPAVTVSYTHLTLPTRFSV